ncbi:MAG: flavin reductase family protein [Candidatus Latescibacteria bacterium]|nr:flavin reductase family protein [Candidatus Latescibacterota bacterium]
MPDEFHSIDPQTLSRQEAHRLLLHCVSPRPIAFTSTLSPNGKPNLAPFSYFMAGGANPPSVVISPLTTRTGELKDTLRNIEATGEYVINVVTYAIRERMNLASAEFPYGVDEFVEAGFTSLPSVKVKPARVAESPLHLECHLFQIVHHGSGPLAANYIIGEVVYFHVSDSVWVDGRIDALRVDAIARMGDNWYCRAYAPAMFEMSRPQAVSASPPDAARA